MTTCKLNPVLHLFVCRAYDDMNQIAVILIQRWMMIKMGMSLIFILRKLLE